MEPELAAVQVAAQVAGIAAALADLGERAAVLPWPCAAGDADIGLFLVTTDPVVAHVLAAAGVHRLFEIHFDIDTALRTMGGPQ